MFLTKQNGAIKISWPDNGWRSDRFCFCSFGSSWHFRENSRQRNVQVGIREGLKTIEPGLMKHKMEAVWLCMVYSDRDRNCSISKP